MLKQVTAEPVAQSNIVAIRATAESPDGARDLANGFADGVVAERDEVVEAEAEKLITGLRAAGCQNAQQNADDTTASARGRDHPA